MGKCDKSYCPFWTEYVLEDWDNLPGENLGKSETSSYLSDPQNRILKWCLNLDQKVNSMPKHAFTAVYCILYQSIRHMLKPLHSLDV